MIAFMPQWAVPVWRLLGVVFDGQEIVVDGVNPWNYEWHRVDGSIEVPHPSYPTQRHELSIWKIEADERAVAFAAGELSNGVWCFYVPDA